VEELGSPHKAYRTIHVVGTNGKSSTTRFISALLEQRAYRGGVRLPHLVSLAERQMVDSVPSTEEEFCELVARIRPVAERLDQEFPRRVAHAVRGPHGRGLSLLQRERVRRGGRRGGPRWTPGRDLCHLVGSAVITTIGRSTPSFWAIPVGHPQREGAVIPRQRQGGGRNLDPELKGELKEICAAQEAACHFLGDQFVVLADPRHASFDVFGIYACYTDLTLKVLAATSGQTRATAVAAVELFKRDGAAD